MEDCLDSVGAEDRSKVVKSPVVKNIQLWGQYYSEISRRVHNTCEFVDKDVSINTDSVDSNMLLHLSCTTVKIASIKLYLVHGTAKILGELVWISQLRAIIVCLSADNKRFPFKACYQQN